MWENRVGELPWVSENYRIYLLREARGGDEKGKGITLEFYKFRSADNSK